MEPLRLRTHTSLWHVERRLYKLYDFTLPVPVSVRQLVIIAAVGIPWVALMNLIGVPFAPPFGHLIWLAPPVLLTWWANKPVAEGKNLMELLTSQARYLRQHKHYARLRPFTPGRRLAARATVWHRSPAPDSSRP